MESILYALKEMFSGIPSGRIVLGIAVLFIGFAFSKILQILINRFLEKFPLQKKNYGLHKILIYSVNVITLLLFLKVIEVDLKYIVGGLGFLTLGVSFAARTSISNLISGIFLIFEKPFSVGDIIEINDIKGEVLSLDLLAVRLRTLDNLMVRIPNEIVAGAAVRNHTYFPIRRLDLSLVFSHKESFTNIHNLLVKTAKGHEMALNEPEPYFKIKGFYETYVEVQFSVWSSREDFFKFTSDFPKRVHRAIKNSGIDQPYQRIKISEATTSKSEGASS